MVRARFNDENGWVLDGFFATLEVARMYFAMMKETTPGIACVSLMENVNHAGWNHLPVGQIVEPSK